MGQQETFTREELLAAMTLTPCHITGTHDPQHTPKYICTYQAKDALNGLLDLLGLTLRDLPRQPHQWPASGERGLLEQAWIDRRPITFTVSFLPERTFDNFSDAWVTGCDLYKEHGVGKFTVCAQTEGLDEPVWIATY